jgi:hypothetical protein
MKVRRWRTTARLGATAMIAAAALAGCGAGDSDSGSTSSGGAAPALADRDAAAPEGAAQQGVDTDAKAPDLSVDQRAIIYTGSITITVDSVTKTAADATAIARRAGGFVGADERHSGSGADEATLELRVPAEKFSSVVEELATVGIEQQRDINTKDVTEETLDLDARIATQQARVTSGRRLLARAKTLSELVMLEGEVAKREADLASLSAKKRRLADLTALSTITAVLLDPDAVAKKDDGDPAGFLGGLANGWKALVASLAVLLTVLGALLPWLIAIGLPVWAAIWLFRRYGSRTSSPAPALATPAGPVPGYPPHGPVAHQPSPTRPSATPPAGKDETPPAGKDEPTSR